MPVQPNEHHALDLTCKDPTAQVTNEVGERLKISLGLTAGGLDPIVQSIDKGQIRYFRRRRDRACHRAYAVGAPPILRPQKVEGIHVELALLRQVYQHLSPDQHAPPRDGSLRLGAITVTTTTTDRLPLSHVPRAVPLVSKASSFLGAGSAGSTSNTGADVRLVSVPAGVTQEEDHAGFLQFPSAVLALIFRATRNQPFLSLVDREVEFCVSTN